MTIGTVKFSYSVKEIDDMRISIQKGNTSLYSIEPGDHASRALQIESRLRTYMEGGVDPDDLYVEMARQLREDMAERKISVYKTVEVPPTGYFWSRTKLELRRDFVGTRPMFSQKQFDEYDAGVAEEIARRAALRSKASC